MAGCVFAEMMSRVSAGSSSADLVEAAGASNGGTGPVSEAFQGRDHEVVRRACIDEAQEVIVVALEPSQERSSSRAELPCCWGGGHAG